MHLRKRLLDVLVFTCILSMTLRQYKGFRWVKYWLSVWRLNNFFFFNLWSLYSISNLIVTYYCADIILESLMNHRVRWTLQPGAGWCFPRLWCESWWFRSVTNPGVNFAHLQGQIQNLGFVFSPALSSELSTCTAQRCKLPRALVRIGFS